MRMIPRLFPNLHTFTLYKIVSEDRLSYSGDGDIQPRDTTHEAVGNHEGKRVTVENQISKSIVAYHRETLCRKVYKCKILRLDTHGMVEQHIVAGFHSPVKTVFK